MDYIAPKLGKCVTYEFCAITSSIPLHFVPKTPGPRAYDGHGNLLSETPQEMAESEMNTLAEWAKMRDRDEVFFDRNTGMWKLLQVRNVLRVREEAN